MIVVHRVRIQISKWLCIMTQGMSQLYHPQIARMTICRLSSTTARHSDSDLSEDSLDMNDEIYELYDDDEADCWEDSVSFGAQHNLNVGSVEQPWKSI